MFKKILSLSMTLVLLFTVLSVGVVLNTSAADLSASLIAGKAPIAVSGSSCSFDTVGTRADMTDGKLKADGGAYWKATDWGGACSVNFTYDMGATYSVSSALYELASAALDGCYDEIKIYVGASSDGLFTDANLAAHYKQAEISGAPIEIPFKTVFTGRYIGFAVYAEQSDYGVLVSEFAAFEAETIDFSGNLLSGKTPSVGATSCTPGTAGALADMTDGVLWSAGGSMWRCTDWGGACSVKLTYNLGAVYSMDSFLYEHGNGNPTADCYDEIRVYVSDKESTLYDAANQVTYYKELERGSAVPITMTLDYSVAGQYVGFIVYADGSGDYGVKIGELAAFKSEEINLIAGKTATIMEGTDLQGDITHLTDGIIASGNVASVDTGVDNNGQSEFVFELDNMTEIEKLFIASVTGETKYYLYAGDVYVSDSLEDLWNENNVALHFDYGYNNAARCYVYDLEQPVTGKYVGFSFPFASTNNEWWYRARVAELGVYGTEQVQVNNGAQVRNPQATDDFALRFSFDVYNTGVAYADEAPVANNNYARDLTNAYIKIAGESYKLKDMGAVVANTDAFGEELTKEDVTDGRIADVPAANLYEVAEGVATYTAVVTGIPAAHVNTTLYAVSYVTYETDDGDVTIYGDVISRTVTDVLNG